MSPPPLADRALRLLLHQGMAEDVIGDLHEEYAEFKLGELGPSGAGFWYWRQALAVLWRFGRLRVPGTSEPALLSHDRPRGAAQRWVGLGADLRYSVRRLAMSPGFTATAIGTLALGIGVTSAVFSAVHGVLLEPLPYDRPEELVLVGGRFPGVGDEALRASAPEYWDYVRQSASIGALAADWVIDANLTGSDEPVRIVAAVTTPNLFPLLGVTPAMGRALTERDAESVLGYRLVALLSHDTWEGLFEGDPEIVGRQVRIDGDPFTIIGVMPEGFRHPGEAQGTPVQVWVPLDLSEEMTFPRGGRLLTLVGRLSSGFTVEESQRELGDIAAVQRRDHPESYPPGSGWTVSVVPLLDEMVSGVQATLLLLFGLASIVFLVVMANVANLHVTRGAGRSRELAIRAVLGGTRLRIGRQLFLESLLVSAVGAAAGLGVAYLGADLLRRLVSREFPRIDNIAVDGSVLLFALLASLLAVLVFGLLPALRLSTVRPRRITQGHQRKLHAGRHRLRGTFVGAQTALSLVLLIGAGLLLRSFDALGRVDLGFDPERVLTMETLIPIPLNQSEGRYVLPEQRMELVDRALGEMERLPGVTRAAVASLLPLRGLAGVTVNGEEFLGGDKKGLNTAELRVVSEGYFDVMGIQVTEGRPFVREDGDHSPNVVIVSSSFADRYFPGASPLGKKVRLGGSKAPELLVVGVVEDVAYQVPDNRSRETAYRPARQWVGNKIAFVLRTTDSPASLADAMVGALHRAGPDVAGFSVTSMEEIVAGVRSQHRVLTLLFSLFGVQTLLLSATGIYGVVSFAVTRRSHEIGVRLALGGAKAGILGMLLSEGFRLGLAGAAVGLVAAVGLSPFLRAVLYQVRPWDPWIYVEASAFALVIVTLASLIPAFGVLRVDAGTTLKTE